MQWLEKKNKTEKRDWRKQLTFLSFDGSGCTKSCFHILCTFFKYLTLWNGKIRHI